MDGESLWQTPLPARAPPAAFELLSPYSEPLKLTEGRIHQSEAFACLSRVVKAVCAEHQRDEQAMEAGTLLPAHRQQKGPHLLTQFTPAAPLVSLHTSV